jgi:hypothetical protein
MSSKSVSIALLATTIVLGAAQILHAEPPTFAAGETLSASKMNSSFASLSNRLDALEKSAAVPAVPPGTIIAFGGPNLPDGWLLCDGSAVDRVAEPTLFEAIGTAWGAPDVTKFNLPDLRGRFLRGVDGPAARDPDSATRTPNADGGNAGNLVGSIEDQQLLAHTHSTPVFGLAVGFLAGGAAQVALPSGAASYPSTPAGGNETRPKNANVVYLIKR